MKALALDLDTYMVLDERPALDGTVKLMETENVGRSCRICVSDLAGQTVHWQTVVPLSGAASEHPFSIPVGDLPGGYYRLRATVEPHGPSRETTLAIKEVRSAPATPIDGGDARYLSFVVATIETIVDHQSVRFGGEPDGIVCLTTADRSTRSYRSLGHRKGDTFHTIWFPEQPFELDAARLDMELWPILDRLSELTGKARYAEMVTAMAEAFAGHGFDKRSGLGYLGEEADFDVLKRRPLPRGTYDTPKFKPNNTGNLPGLPLDRLWRHAPDQTARMFRAMYYGLVTDPAEFGYNRFCYYDFSDADKRPSLEPNSGHCAFETAGARMIHWWASCYAHTGDADCLHWAQRMADKWRAIQHPVSGLVPNFFGAQPGLGAVQPPGRWADSRGAALSSVTLLEAAGELRRRAGAESLARQLDEMGTALALGVARHAYDRGSGIFREVLQLDGRPYGEAARYTFPTQAEKDAAVGKDPLMRQVRVYAGCGFYHPGPYWRHCAGSHIPGCLAQAAELTGSEELLEHASALATDAVEASRQQVAAFTDEGMWTFYASGETVKMLVRLYRVTRDGQYLAWAREIADRELSRLASVVCPDWWRLRERSTLLDALLVLHAEQGSG